jgi:predicted DNA-binding transcriptional regulator YafY
MLQTIISAIQQKEVISFTYDGHPREVEPYAVGVSRTGHKVLRCFQVRGYLQHDHSWVLVPLSKIADLATTAQNFSSKRTEYKSGDKGMTIIYAQV